MLQHILMYTSALVAMLACTLTQPAIRSAQRTDHNFQPYTLPQHSYSTTDIALKSAYVWALLLENHPQLSAAEKRIIAEKSTAFKETVRIGSLEYLEDLRKALTKSSTWQAKTTTYLTDYDSATSASAATTLDIFFQKEDAGKFMLWNKDNSCFTGNTERKFDGYKAKFIDHPITAEITAEQANSLEAAAKKECPSAKKFISVRVTQQNSRIRLDAHALLQYRLPLACRAKTAPETSSDDEYRELFQQAIIQQPPPQNPALMAKLSTTVEDLKILTLLKKTLRESWITQSINHQGKWIALEPLVDKALAYLPPTARHPHVRSTLIQELKSPYALHTEIGELQKLNYLLLRSRGEAAQQEQKQTFIPPVDPKAAYKTAFRLIITSAITDKEGLYDPLLSMGEDARNECLKTLVPFNDTQHLAITLPATIARQAILSMLTLCDDNYVQLAAEAIASYWPVPSDKKTVEKLLLQLHYQQKLKDAVIASLYQPNASYNKKKNTR
jgi:hypothetical protein